jgi:ribosomal protein S27E
MITGISYYRCKCGVRVQVLTETDKARIGEAILLEVACPKCSEKQAIHAHRIIKISIDVQGGQSAFN